MSYAIADRTVPSTAPEQQAVATRLKLDQWICFWSIPVFYNLFGLIFVYFAKLMPPPPPSLSTAEIVAFIQVNATHLQIAMVILMLSLGLASLSNGLVLVQMKRMEGVSQWLSYGYLAALATAALPGCLLCGFFFALATFRPERDPKIIAMLYDAGMLSFVGSLGCFIVQYTMFGIAVLLDKREIFPKWFGYMTIWALVTELVAGPVWIFTTGPFAWNGLLAFYQGTVIWLSWQTCQTVLLAKAIKRQQLEEAGAPA